MGHQVSASLGVLSLWGAFLLGLVGGFGHCLMMCGPLVAAASLTDGASRGASAADGEGSGGAGVPCAGARNPARSAGVFQLAYHLGRLATYAMLGALLGLLGEAGALATLSGPFSPTSVSRFLKLAAGGAMLVMGVVLLVAWFRGRQARLPEPTAAIVSLPWFGRTVARLAKSGGWWGLPLGALMGLLPCAPLLPVELAALATAKPLYGAVMMLVFGLGTVPALAGFGAASGLLGSRARGWLAPTVATLVVVLGVVTVAQGLASAGAL
jgi:sulfite exporter TauE/SafE